MFATPAWLPRLALRRRSVTDRVPADDEAVRPPPSRDDGDGRAPEADAGASRALVRAVVASVLREPLDHPDVEDCTHETLRRALEDPAKGSRPIVIGIARHVALDALRARKRARDRRGDEGGEPSERAPLVERVPDTADDPFERVAKARRGEAVRAAVASLPDGQRHALTLFHFEGLGYVEIAARLGVPLGTVATWVLRGRKAVAEAVAEVARDS
jgi:RNA polymerase sigma-70 factor (ECF subfamily)